MADRGSLFSDLIRFETALWSAVDARLQAEHDLKLSWFETMQVVDSVPDCRVFDIKEELLITIGGTSKLVDRIEAAGWCRRRANPEDRRSQIIELTPAGRRLMKRATATFEDEVGQRIELVLSENALKQFATALRKLRLANRLGSAEIEGSEASLA